jgi:hypothetical protein
MKLNSVLLKESASADDLAELLGRYYRIVTEAARARHANDRDSLNKMLMAQEKIEDEIEFVLSQRN